MNETNGCLLVSFDFSNGKDNSVLIVGRKKELQDVEIINAFQGKAAENLYKKLTTVVKKKEETPNE